MLMQTVCDSEREIGTTEASKYEAQKLIGVKRSDGIMFPVKIFTKVLIVMQSGCQAVPSAGTHTMRKACQGERDTAPTFRSSLPH